MRRNDVLFVVFVKGMSLVCQVEQELPADLCVVVDTLFFPL